MSGEIDTVPGKILTENEGINNAKMNQVLMGFQARMASASISERELSIGTKTAITPVGSESIPVVKDGVLSKMSTADVRRMMATYDVRDYGAVGDGATNDTAAIQATIDAAFAGGGGQVVFPAGEYNIHDRINLKDGVYLEGSGSGTTELNLESIGDVALGMIFAEGTMTELTGVALTAAIAPGDTTFTFTGTHGWTPGDIFVVRDNADYSYSNERTYYKKGEMFRVWSVVGNTIRTTTSAFDDYSDGGANPPAAMKIYRMTPIRTGIRGFRMKFRQNYAVAGIRLSHGSGCYLEDLDLSGNIYTHINLDRCYEVSCTRVRAVDWQSAGSGWNYGILVEGSQRLNISQCFLETSRHGFAAGQGNTDGNIIIREVTIANSHVSSRGASFGLDFHGDCEHCVVTGCNLPNGILVGADFMQVIGCDISDNNDVNIGLGNREAIGASFSFIGNSVVATRHVPTGVIQARFNINNFRRPGGMFRIANNTVHMRKFRNPAGTGTFTSAIRVFSSNAPDEGSQKIYDLCIDISENSVKWDTIGGIVNVYAIAVTPHFSGRVGFKNVTIKGNSCIGAGIVSWLNVETLVVENNTIVDAQINGLYFLKLPLPATPEIESQLVSVLNNTICRSNYAGITGTLVDEVTMIVRGNTSINNAKGGSLGSYNSLNLVDGNDVFVSDNTFGGSPQNRSWIINGAARLIAQNNVNLGNILAVLTPDIYHGGFENVAAPRVNYLAAAPTTGTFRRGDIVWNTTPTAAETPGWICTTATDGETPAVFKAMAILEA